MRILYSYLLVFGKDLGRREPKKVSFLMVFGALKSAFERGYFVTRRGAYIHYYIETAI